MMKGKLFVVCISLCFLLTACGDPVEITIGGESSESSNSQSVSDSGSQSGESGQTQNSQDSSESQAPADNRTIEEKLEDALAVNTDTKAWIQIAGTYVDYPVMQSGDNNFYLEKNLDKSYYWYGSVFANYQNDLSSASSLNQNTVLFGHNKNDGLMFGSLVNYESSSYGSAHPFITLLIGGEKTTWEIFAALDCEVNSGVFPYIQTSLSDDLIAQARDRSFLDFDVQVSSSDKILTLSTCTYQYAYSSGKYREDVRFVVMAKLVEEGTPAPLITVNNDRRTPVFA